MRTILLATAATLLLGSTTGAHEFKGGSITVEHPWARPAARGSGAAYFVVENGASRRTGCSVSAPPSPAASRCTARR